MSSRASATLDSNQFLSDLIYGVDELGLNRLNDDYMAQIGDLFAAIFAERFPTVDDPAQAYEVYLSCCLRALIELGRHLPPQFFQQQGSNTLFQIAYELSRDITEENSQASIALRRFTDIFHDCEALKQTGMIKVREDAPEYLHDGMAHSKQDFNEFQKLPPVQRICVETPFWQCWESLIPATPAQLPFEIPRERWFEGAWIVANQGRGKTNLLRHLLLNLPEPDAAVILMDAKGDLINSFNHMAAFQDRLVLLEPDEEHPLAVNPLNVGSHSVEFLEYVFAALLETPLTPLQATLFRLALTLAVTIPQATLETFRDIIQNGWKRYESYVRKLRPRDQDFFVKEFDSAVYSKTKQEILWRLRTLMTVPSLDAMFQSPVTKLDIGKLMDAGKIICINNNYELLGDQGAEFFGRFFVALVWAAARRRSRLPDHLKKPVYFVIDEAHYVIARDTKIATILHQCRSQKISMIFAHQEVQQIKDEDVRSALTNCAIKFANSTGEAHELAPRMDSTADFIKAQKRGQFATYVRDLTLTAVSLDVPLIDLREHPTMGEDEFAEILERTHANYCQSPFDEEAESLSEPEPPPDDDPEEIG